MAEINLKDLAKRIGAHPDSQYLQKTVNIIGDEKQYTIRIPKKYAEAARINPRKDTFTFTLVPKKDSAPTLKAELNKQP
ncbi:MAG: hypothetical protein ABIC95_03160 [archaeon]